MAPGRREFDDSAAVAVAVPLPLHSAFRSSAPENISSGSLFHQVSRSVRVSLSSIDLISRRNTRSELSLVRIRRRINCILCAPSTYLCRAITDKHKQIHIGQIYTLRESQKFRTDARTCSRSRGAKAGYSLERCTMSSPSLSLFLLDIQMAVCVNLLQLIFLSSPHLSLSFSTEYFLPFSHPSRPLFRTRAFRHRHRRRITRTSVDGDITPCTATSSPSFAD